MTFSNPGGTMHVRSYGEFTVIEKGNQYVGCRFTVTADDGTFLTTGLVIDDKVYWGSEMLSDPSVLFAVEDYFNL